MGSIYPALQRHVKKCVVLAPPTSQPAIFNPEENMTEL